jgi:hypothetical protein
MLGVKLKNPPEDLFPVGSAFFEARFPKSFHSLVSHHSSLPDFTPSGFPDKICGLRKILFIYFIYNTKQGNLPHALLPPTPDKLINPFVQQDNMDKKANVKKVKVQLDEDVLNGLLKLKEVGDTYSDVVRRLLGRVKG